MGFQEATQYADDRIRMKPRNSDHLSYSLSWHYRLFLILAKDLLKAIHGL